MHPNSFKIYIKNNLFSWYTRTDMKWYKAAMIYLTFLLVKVTFTSMIVFLQLCSWIWFVFNQFVYLWLTPFSNYLNFRETVKCTIELMTHAICMLRGYIENIAVYSLLSPIYTQSPLTYIVSVIFRLVS